MRSKNAYVCTLLRMKNMLARCPNFSLKPLEKLCQHEKYRLLKMKENLEKAVFSVLKKALGNFDLVKHESSKILLVSSGVIIGKLNS